MNNDHEKQKKRKWCGGRYIKVGMLCRCQLVKGMVCFLIMHVVLFSLLLIITLLTTTKATTYPTQPNPIRLT